jgi:uncharacterized protein
MSDRESFPSVQQAAFLLLAGFLLQYLIGAAMYDSRASLNLSQSQADALVVLVSNGILLACVVHYRGSSHRDLLHPSTSSPLSALVLLVPPVLLLVPGIMLLDDLLISGLESLFPLSAWEEQAFAQMVSDNLGAVISTCILAPVLEEMLFRGVLLRSFLVQHTRWAAISFSALFFGAAHLNLYQFILAFALGLLLGWLFERSRSLIPCIALHAAVNTWVVTSSITAPGDQRTTAIGGPAAWFVAVVAAMLGLFILRRLLTRGTVGSSKNAA